MSDIEIANMFINNVRNDLKLRLIVIQQQIQERYNLVAKCDQCRKAKTKALNQIQAEFDEQFLLLNLLHIYSSSANLSLSITTLALPLVKLETFTFVLTPLY